MKRFYHITAAAIVLFAMLPVSCQKADITENGKDPTEDNGEDGDQDGKDDANTLNAGIEAFNPSPEDSRIPESFGWEPGDRITVYAYKDGKYQSVAEYETEGSGLSAKFSPTEKGTVLPEDAEHFLAVFPTEVSVSPEGVISATIPDVQDIKMTNVYANRSQMPMAAKFTGKDIMFRHICAVVEIAVKAPSTGFLDNTEFVLKSDSRISGEITARLSDDGIPEVISSSGNSVRAILNSAIDLLDSQIHCPFIISPMASVTSLTFDVMEGEDTRFTTALQDGIPSEISRAAYVALPEFGIEAEIPSDPVLEIEGETSTTLDSVEGGTVEFKVNSNIPWNIECADETVTCEKKDENTVSVNVGNNPYFFSSGRNIEVNIIPENKGIDLKATFTIHQDMCGEFESAAMKMVNELTGAVTIIGQESSHSRFVFSNAGLGTYIWKFSEVFLGTNADDKKSFAIIFDKKVYYNFRMGQYNTFLSGGKYTTEGGETIDFSKDKDGNAIPSQSTGLTLSVLNNMKELKMSFEPAEGDPTSLNISISVNGENKVTSIGRRNYWYFAPADMPMSIYFGIESGARNAPEPGRVTIDSFQFIPYTE